MTIPKIIHHIIPSYKTKHMMTGMWGKEAVDHVESQINSSLDIGLDELYVAEMKRYVDLNGVHSVSDFYYDYTNGGMKTYFAPDLDKSDTDSLSTLQYG